MRKIVLLVLAVFCYGNALSDGPKEVDMDEETPKTPDTLDTVSQSKAKKYPAVFHDPPEETVMGISFVPYKGAETDYERAKNMALRQLALSKWVRVRGKISHDEGLTDLIGLRWEKFVSKEWKVFQIEYELLEVPSVALEACVVETLIVDNLAWVSVHLRNEERPSWGQWDYFRPDSLADFNPPSWFTKLPHSVYSVQWTLPNDDDWLYGTGACQKCPLRMKQTVGKGLCIGHFLNWHSIGQVRILLISVCLIRIHLFILLIPGLQGFRVAARWRDDKHLYVLVRVPKSGVKAISDIEALKQEFQAWKAKQELLERIKENREQKGN